MQNVSIVLLEQSLVSSISLPMEMLNAANEMARGKDRRIKPINIQLVSYKKEAVVSSSGLTLYATSTFTEIKQSDLIILPALWRNPIKALRQHPTIIPWLKNLAQQDSLICAVGTSSCFLAEAGLLDHKPATTHWLYGKQFAQRYPQVELKQQYLITQADNIYCAGSVNSVADLIVHLIDRFYGHNIAKQVEGQFSPEIRRPFESHAYAQFDTNLHQDESIILAQEWLQSNSQEDILFSDLAAYLQLSLRTLNRRFKQAVGITAGEYLQNLRLNNAKELLRTSNLSIAEVAENCGYQNSSYFCARFKKVMTQTPLAYRKTVRGKLFKVV